MKTSTRLLEVCLPPAKPPPRPTRDPFQHALAPALLCLLSIQLGFATEKEARALTVPLAPWLGLLWTTSLPRCPPQSRVCMSAVPFQCRPSHAEGPCPARVDPVGCGPSRLSSYNLYCCCAAGRGKPNSMLGGIGRLRLGVIFLVVFAFAAMWHWREPPSKALKSFWLPPRRVGPPSLDGGSTGGSAESSHALLAARGDSGGVVDIDGGFEAFSRLASQVERETAAATAASVAAHTAATTHRAAATAPVSGGQSMTPTAQATPTLGGWTPPRQLINQSQWPASLSHGLHDACRASPDLERRRLLRRISARRCDEPRTVCAAIHQALPDHHNSKEMQGLLLTIVHLPSQAALLDTFADVAAALRQPTVALVVGERMDAALKVAQRQARRPCSRALQHISPSSKSASWQPHPP